MFTNVKIVIAVCMSFFTEVVVPDDDASLCKVIIIFNSIIQVNIFIVIIRKL